MTHADTRPRVHIRPTPIGCRWGTHPNALGTDACDPGDAVNAGRGVVVILEGLA